jgi:hypothetical protein
MREQKQIRVLIAVTKRYLVDHQSITSKKNRNLEHFKGSGDENDESALEITREQKITAEYNNRDSNCNVHVIFDKESAESENER